MLSPNLRGKYQIHPTYFGRKSASFCVTKYVPSKFASKEDLSSAWRQQRLAMRWISVTQCPPTKLIRSTHLRYNRAEQYVLMGLPSWWKYYLCSVESSLVFTEATHPSNAKFTMRSRRCWQADIRWFYGRKYKSHLCENWSWYFQSDLLLHSFKRGLPCVIYVTLWAPIKACESQVTAHVTQICPE